jgi:hypothetical protein
MQFKRIRRFEFCTLTPLHYYQQLIIAKYESIHRIMLVISNVICRSGTEVNLQGPQPSGKPAPVLLLQICSTKQKSPGVPSRTWKTVELQCTRQGTRSLFQIPRTLSALNVDHSILVVSLGYPSNLRYIPNEPIVLYA